MKEELKKLYNEKKSLEIKIENLLKASYLKEGRAYKEKMYKIVTETRDQLEKINKKIKFIENLSLEMEANEMFYSKKNIKSKNVL